MYRLSRIQSSVQEAAEAIASVLSVDVTVVDNSLKRIAATGKYKELIGETLPKGCSYDYIINNKSSEIIIKKDLSERCLNCDMASTCDEIATLGYPIMSNDLTCLGVIGIIAFDQDQRNYIYNNLEAIKIFLKKISSLIAGNLSYEDANHNLTVRNKEISNIVNSIDSGIIFTDQNFNIKNFNSKALNILNIEAHDLVDKNLSDVFVNMTIDDSKKQQLVKSAMGGEFLLKLILTSLDDNIISSIAQIESYSDAIESAYDILGSKYKISFADIVGESPSLKATLDLAKRISSGGDSTVMVRGESGTGKELFARAIHNNSPRKNKPFVAINCASIPENLLESELFGYEKGAFTGANERGKLGRFELANGGTLFLDEIGDLPIHLQPKLLRVLQDRSFVRLGGKKRIQINFRLITATNKNLEKMVLDNTFRDDLYYRLNVIPINIPPLRQRPEDIPLIADLKLRQYCKKLNKNGMILSPATVDILKSYAWPGNIRELENIIEYLVNISNDQIISQDLLPLKFKTVSAPSPDYSKQSVSVDIENETLKALMDKYEKDVLSMYVRHFGSSTSQKQEIADKLGINLSTLYRKLYRYNLD